MNNINSICLYCGASPDVAEIYKKAAVDFGSYCAQNGLELVYGGGHTGLMGIAADAALQHGGKVTGIIPDFLVQKEVAHRGLDQLYITQNMHERQHKMAELSDAFVMLPGGLGSLAEFFEIVTWRQLGLHNKPIYVYNIGGYWNELDTMIGHIKQSGFLRGEVKNLYRMINDLDEIAGIKI